MGCHSEKTRCDALRTKIYFNRHRLAYIRIVTLYRIRKVCLAIWIDTLTSSTLSTTWQDTHIIKITILLYECKCYSMVTRVPFRFQLSPIWFVMKLRTAFEADECVEQTTRKIVPATSYASKIVHNCIYFTYHSKIKITYSATHLRIERASLPPFQQSNHTVMVILQWTGTTDLAFHLYYTSL